MQELKAASVQGVSEGSLPCEAVADVLSHRPLQRNASCARLLIPKCKCGEGTAQPRTGSAVGKETTSQNSV